MHKSYIIISSKAHQTKKHLIANQGTCRVGVQVSKRDDWRTAIWVAFTSEAWCCPSWSAPTRPDL